MLAFKCDRCGKTTEAVKMSDKNQEYKKPDNWSIITGHLGTGDSSDLCDECTDAVRKVVAGEAVAKQ